MELKTILNREDIQNLVDFLNEQLEYMFMEGGLYFHLLIQKFSCTRINGVLVDNVEFGIYGRPVPNFSKEAIPYLKKQLSCCRTLIEYLDHANIQSNEDYFECEISAKGKFNIRKCIDFVKPKKKKYMVSFNQELSRIKNIVELLNQ